MDIKLAIAYWKLGNLPSEDLPKIAMQALESGLDSQSLRVLAGEQNKEMSTLSPLFEKCVKELNIPVPTNKESVFIIARHYAQQITSSKINPIVGAEAIISEAYHMSDNEDDCDNLLVFSGLSSEYYDFNDDVNIKFYGKEKCKDIQEKLSSDVINEAKILLGPQA